MKKRRLILLRQQIKDLQQRIADGTYGQGKLTRLVNKVNELKREEQEIATSL